MYKNIIKRFFDIVLSLLLLVILSPLLLVITVLVRVKLGNPVVFYQMRPGLDKKIFKLYKFRTMTDERDKNGEMLSDKLRLTPFGKALRATSFDELLELWNILIGDMSFVGPRPLLTENLDYYTEREMKRQNVRPGLTGYDQMNSDKIGRDNWEKRLEADVYYVEHLSFTLDCKLFFQTFVFLFRRIKNQDEGDVSIMRFKEYRMMQMQKGHYNE